MNERITNSVIAIQAQIIQMNWKLALNMTEELRIMLEGMENE